MAERIVDRLKVVDIEQNAGERLFALRRVNPVFQNYVQLPAVERAGQVVYMNLSALNVGVNKKD